MMKSKIGLWVDHRKAVVAVVAGGKEKVNVIESKVDKQLARYNGVRSTDRFDRLQVAADDSQDRGFMNQINKYYDKVIALIKDAESILIFGPGEAKIELKKRLEKNKLGGHIATVESADKMTDRQIEAKVREYYKVKVPPSRKTPKADLDEVRVCIGKAPTQKPAVLSAISAKKENMVNPSCEEVAKLAYLIYLKEGCPQGHAIEHWLKAESQLKTI